METQSLFSKQSKKKKDKKERTIHESPLELLYFQNLRAKLVKDEKISEQDENNVNKKYYQF